MRHTYQHSREISYEDHRLAGIFVAGWFFWTGLVALAAQLTEWLVATVSSGQVTDLAATAGQWPVPAWLALWVDPAWLPSQQLAAVELVQRLGQLLPTASSLMAWIRPLLWIGWGLGAGDIDSSRGGGAWALAGGSPGITHKVITFKR